MSQPSMATEYILGVVMKEKLHAGHNRYYEDIDGIFRCSACNKIVDPDEMDWALEEAK